MKSQRMHVWISRIRGTPAGPVGEVTEMVVGVPIDDSRPLEEPSDGQATARRTLGIIALVVFAPVVVIVVAIFVQKVLRDIRSGMH